MLDWGTPGFTSFTKYVITLFRNALLDLLIVGKVGLTNNLAVTIALLLTRKFHLVIGRFYNEEGILSSGGKIQVSYAKVV